MAQDASKNKIFRFMDLPPELRNRIYEEVFEIGTDCEIDIFEATSRAPSAALPATCRQVHREGIGYLQDATCRFWTASKFIATFAPSTLAGDEPLRAILARCRDLNVPPLCAFEIRISSTTQDNATHKALQLKFAPDVERQYNIQLFLAGMSECPSLTANAQILASLLEYVAVFSGPRGLLVGQDRLSVRNCILMFLDFTEVAKKTIFAMF